MDCIENGLPLLSHMVKVFLADPAQLVANELLPETGIKRLVASVL